MTDYLKTDSDIYSQGFGMLSKKVMRDRDLKVGPKALYGYIITYAGAGTVAWPGRDLICKDLCISKNTYTIYMRELKEKDYIRVQQQKSPNGKFSNNTYIIVTNPNPQTPATEGFSPCTKNVYTEKRSTENYDSNNNSIKYNNVVVDNGKEKIKEKIKKTTGGVVVSNSFISRITNKYTADQIDIAIGVLGEQIKRGVDIESVEAFLLTSLKNGWYKGQAVKGKKRVSKKGKPRSKTNTDINPGKDDAKRELIKSLYMN